MGKRIISFALWGQKNTYNRGAIDNVKLAEKYYPGWICRFYCAADAPAYEELLRLDCEVVLKEPVESWFNLFWRCSAAADPEAEYCIFRDCDSRLNPREVGAVKEWLDSGKSLHIMHDSRDHSKTAIMSGMWGIEGGWLPNIEIMIERWIAERYTSSFHKKVGHVDEMFLQEVVWPMFKYGNYIGHGASWEGSGGNERPFPPHEPLDGFTFVGEPVLLAEQQEIRPDLPKLFFFRGKRNGN